MNGTFHLTFLMISAVRRAVMVPQEMGKKLRCYTQEVHKAMWIAWLHQNNNIIPPPPQWAMHIPCIISPVAKKRRHFLRGLRCVLTTLTTWKTSMTSRICGVQRGCLIQIIIYFSSNLPCGRCRLAESIAVCVIFVSGELMLSTH